MHVEFRILCIHNAHTLDPDTYHNVRQRSPTSSTAAAAAAGRDGGAVAQHDPRAETRDMNYSAHAHDSPYVNVPLNDQNLAVLSRERVTDGVSFSSQTKYRTAHPAHRHNHRSRNNASTAHSSRGALYDTEDSRVTELPLQRGGEVVSSRSRTHSRASRATSQSNAWSAGSASHWPGLDRVRSLLGWGGERAMPAPVLRLQFIVEGMTPLESSDLVCAKDACQPHYGMAEELVAAQDEQEEPSSSSSSKESANGDDVVRRHRGDSTRSNSTSSRQATSSYRRHTAGSRDAHARRHHADRHLLAHARKRDGVHITRCSVTPMEVILASLPGSVADAMVKIRLVQLPPSTQSQSRSRSHDARRGSRGLSTSSRSSSSSSGISSQRHGTEADSVSNTWRSNESGGRHSSSSSTRSNTHINSSATRYSAYDSFGQSNGLTRVRAPGVRADQEKSIAAEAEEEEESLCIGVGKVSFRKLMSSPSGVRLALQPKASLTRWMEQHYGMESTEVACLLGRSLGGSAFVMFQVVTYTFGSIPLSRLLVAGASHAGVSKQRAQTSNQRQRGARGSGRMRNDYHEGTLGDYGQRGSSAIDAVSTAQQANLRQSPDLATLGFGNDVNLVASEPTTSLSPPNVALRTTHTTQQPPAAHAARLGNVDDSTLLTPELGDINSIVVRFTIIPYIAVIDSVLRIHHVLMWHRPLKTVLLVFIVCLMTVNDVLGWGLLLAALLQTILFVRTTLRWYHTPLTQRDGVSWMPILTAKTGLHTHLYSYQNYILNAMVRARLFFMHGLQGDCYYELVLLFHIMRRRQRRLYVMAALLVLITLVASVESIVVLGLLGLFVAYPATVYTSSVKCSPRAPARTRTGKLPAWNEEQQAMHMAHMAWIHNRPIRVMRVVQVLVEKPDQSAQAALLRHVREPPYASWTNNPVEQQRQQRRPPSVMNSSEHEMVTAMRSASPQQSKSNRNNNAVREERLSSHVGSTTATADAIQQQQQQQQHFSYSRVLESELERPSSTVPGETQALYEASRAPYAVTPDSSALLPSGTSLSPHAGAALPTSPSQRHTRMSHTRHNGAPGQTIVNPAPTTIATAKANNATTDAALFRVGQASPSMTFADVTLDDRATSWTSVPSVSTMATRANQSSAAFVQEASQRQQLVCEEGEQFSLQLIPSRQGLDTAGKATATTRAAEAATAVVSASSSRLSKNKSSPAHALKTASTLPVPSASRTCKTIISPTALIGATLAFAVVSIQPRLPHTQPDSRAACAGGSSGSGSSYVAAACTAATVAVDSLCTRLRRHREAVRVIQSTLRNSAAGVSADDMRAASPGNALTSQGTRYRSVMGKAAASTSAGGGHSFAASSEHSGQRSSVPRHLHTMSWQGGSNIAMAQDATTSSSPISAVAFHEAMTVYFEETLHLLSYLQRNYRLTSYVSHSNRALESSHDGTKAIRVDSMVQRDWLLADCELAGIAHAVMQMPPSSLTVVRVTDSPDCNSETRTLALLAASLLQGYSLPLFNPQKSCRGGAGSGAETAALSTVYAVVELMSESDMIARLPQPNSCPERLLGMLEGVWRGANAGQRGDKPLALVTAKNLLSIIATYC